MSAIIWKPGLDDGSQGEMPNVGMGILAAEFKRCGHDVIILDHHLSGNMELLKHRIAYTSREWLAVSLVSEEWLNPMTKAVMKYAKDSGMKIMVGGPHAAGYWEYLEREPYIDKIVVGEVDYKLPQVFEHDNRVVVLGQADEFQTPDFSSLEGKDKVFAYPLYTSRGCTNRCSFCAGASTHKRFRRRILNQDFWEEVYSIPRLFPNVKLIHVIDDCFTGDLESAKHFLRLYYKTGHLPLHIINVRADQLDTEVLTLMGNCRVKELPIGVESGHPDVFARIGKNETFQDIETAIGLIQNAGITPWLNMIVGLPGDTPSRAKYSAEWASSLPAPKIVHWFMYAPFRGTRAYSELVKRGIITDGFIPKAYGRRYDNWPWYPDFHYPLFSSGEMGRAQLYAYLICKSPILISDPELENKCRKFHLIKEYRKWLKEAPIEEYKKNHLNFKKEKGQI